MMGDWLVCFIPDFVHIILAFLDKFQMLGGAVTGFRNLTKELSDTTSLEATGVSILDNIIQSPGWTLSHMDLRTVLVPYFDSEFSWSPMNILSWREFVYVVTPALNFKIKIGFEWLCMQFFCVYALIESMSIPEMGWNKRTYWRHDITWSHVTTWWFLGLGEGHLIHPQRPSHLHPRFCSHFPLEHTPETQPRDVDVEEFDSNFWAYLTDWKRSGPTNLGGEQQKSRHDLFPSFCCKIPMNSTMKMYKHHVFPWNLFTSLHLLFNRWGQGS